MRWFGPDWFRALIKARNCLDRLKFPCAITYATKAIKLIHLKAPTQKANLAMANYILGRAACNEGQYDIAARALPISAELYGPIEGPKAQEMRAFLDLTFADLYWGTQKIQQAYDALIRLDVKLQSQTAPPLLRIRTYSFLAEICEKLRLYEEAVVNYEKVMEELTRLQGKEHPNYDPVSQRRDILKTLLAAKASGFPDPLILIQFENGGAKMMDVGYASWVISTLPDPNPKDINEAFDSALSVQLIKKQVEKSEEGKMSVTDHTIWKSNDTDSIAELKKIFQLENQDQYAHMACSGKYLIQLTYEDGPPNTIEWLTPNSIRWVDKWKDDAALIPSEFGVNWMKAHGVSF